MLGYLISAKVKTVKIWTSDWRLLSVDNLLKTVEQTSSETSSSASSATRQTIDPSLVNMKTNWAYRLCHEVMVKSYQTYKDSCTGCCSWPKTYCQNEVGNQVNVSQITWLKRRLKRLTHRAWSIAAFILLQKWKPWKFILKWIQHFREIL